MQAECPPGLVNLMGYDTLPDLLSSVVCCGTKQIELLAACHCLNHVGCYDQLLSYALLTTFYPHNYTFDMRKFVNLECIQKEVVKSHSNDFKKGTATNVQCIRIFGT